MKMKVDIHNLRIAAARELSLSFSQIQLIKSSMIMTLKLGKYSFNNFSSLF